MMSISDDQIKALIARLADGNEYAVSVLSQLDRNQLTLTAIDLDDMQMSGAQIVAAYDRFCNKDILHFIRACAERNPTMIAVVNVYVKDRVARQHGAQTTLPKVDEAVAGILSTASEKNMLTRLDDNAEIINSFFKQMLIEMQRCGKFDSTLRINLDIESGGAWGVFNVALVQLLNRDGTPFVPKVQ
jgi:hypothetical protein